MAVCQGLSGTHNNLRDPFSVYTVKENGFDHAGEDLGYVNAHNLRDHFREVDVRLQSLCLNEQIVGELVQLPHNLSKEKQERVGEEAAAS